MIEHIDIVHCEDVDTPIPVWMLNSRIHQINHAIDQIQLLIDLATPTPYTTTQETTQ
jgi:hypothetical protein